MVTRYSMYRRVAALGNANERHLLYYVSDREKRVWATNKLETCYAAEELNASQSCR